MWAMPSHQTTPGPSASFQPEPWLHQPPHLAHASSALEAHLESIFFMKPTQALLQNAVQIAGSGQLDTLGTESQRGLFLHLCVKIIWYLT